MTATAPVNTPAIDHVALLPAYLAAGTAVLALLADLAVGRRWLTVPATMIGAVATGAACWWSWRGGPRQTFCLPDCSYVWDGLALLIGVLVAAATAVVLALSVPALRAGSMPAGEYCFLLACSMTGGVVLGASRDLITLVIALETLTLPLYALVGLRRRSLASAEAAVTFFVVSVVSTAVTLLGAGLLYAATGAVHFAPLAASVGSRADLISVPLVGVGAVLVLVGLAFKVAAVPFHAWAPSTYDGAALPVAAYLSTASKLGGVYALLVVAVTALRPFLDVAGPALAGIAVLTMTVGNLGALRQQRTVRLLAWSSVAQAGYILAPLGAFAFAAGRAPAAISAAVTATLVYAVFYVVLELGAFGALIALRGPADGGTLDDLQGTASRRPWVAAAFGLALAGLAGLPPGLAGLFAKVAVVGALLKGSAGWLAVIVALNAVVGLVYYVRAGTMLFGRPRSAAKPPLPFAVAAALLLVTLTAVIIGLAPQLVFDLATL